MDGQNDDILRRVYYTHNEVDNVSNCVHVLIIECNKYNSILLLFPAGINVYPGLLQFPCLLDDYFCNAETYRHHCYCM